MDSPTSTGPTDQTAPSLHLLPLPGTDPDRAASDIYSAGTALLIPVGAGLVTGIRSRSATGVRILTTDDLMSRDTTVAGLWTDAALAMLDALGRLTAAHGTALRHRRLDAQVWEVGVIDDCFPAAGLVAHPLLARPTVRALRETPRVAVTASGRLLTCSDGLPPPHPDRLSDLVGGELCGASFTLTDDLLGRSLHGGALQ